jgi:exo-beta-1,3-glucanase (GH17 family)
MVLAESPGPPMFGRLEKAGLHIAIALLVLVSAAIFASWAYLGALVAIPAPPISSNEKLYCISYSPFHGRQTPFDLSLRVDPHQIEDDLTKLASLTDCIRTYSTDFGLDHVVEVAARLNLKVMQGIWIGEDKVRNRREMATVAALAKRFPGVIRSVVVGNECLLRGEISPVDLAGFVRDAKAQMSLPVTYADVWEFWLRYRELSDVVDFVTIHVLPYWEDIPVSADKAAAHLEDVIRTVKGAFPGKEIFVGEFGWPSAGRMREGALPSPANQAQVIQDVLTLAKREHFHVNLIEAFDQPWKRQFEGTVGGSWGLFDDIARKPKFVWGRGVSNHPHWGLQAAGGLVLAAAIFGMAAAARDRGVNRPLRSWLGVATMALIAGVLAGWAIENMPQESFGLDGWARSIVLVALSLTAPLAGAAGLMRHTVTPSFAQMLGGGGDRPRDFVGLALGTIFIVLCAVSLEAALGQTLVPRYRDLPFAPLTAAATPYLVLTMLVPRQKGPRGLAESVMATALAGPAIIFVINEKLASWQSLWLCAVMLMMAFILSRARDARDSE